MTSGVLLFGKTKAKAKELSLEISKKCVEKEYLALVKGDFPRFRFM